MNIYKESGMFLLFFLCTWMGFSKSLDLKRRRKCLENFERFLLLLEEEIDFEISDLPDTFLRLGNKNLHEFSEIIRNSRYRLLQYNNERIEEIWKSEVDKKTWNYMKKEDITLIRELGEDLGCVDKNMQIAMLGLYRKRICEQQKKARRCEEKNKNVYRGMGVIAGFLLLIFIW